MALAVPLRQARLVAEWQIVCVLPGSRRQPRGWQSVDADALPAR